LDVAQRSSRTKIKSLQIDRKLTKVMKEMPIPIIDLFAGPGGLGEGFSALRRSGLPVFKIRLSIEKDTDAHRTLELRAFYRQFPDHQIPPEYYQYLHGQISRTKLFGAHPVAGRNAQKEALNATLGITPPEEIDARIGESIAGSRNWLLIGGPPCQAYSLVGRSKIIGEKGRKEYEADHRHFLYREYLRIIADFQPRVFVMENVKGLLSATINGQSTISKILDDLQHPIAAIHGPRHRDAKRTYRLISLSVPSSEVSGELAPADFIVKAEKYAVPQRRHRLIIVGVAERVKCSPSLLTEQPETTVADAIDDLPPLRSGLSKEPDSDSGWCEIIRTIRQSAWLNTPQVDAAVRRQIKKKLWEVPTNFARGQDLAQPSHKPLRLHPKWFRPDDYTGVCNHATRSHIRADLHRYFFLAAFAQVHARSPLLEEFPRELLPKHKNVASALKENKFNDRFRVQVLNRPATTVVSHISKDGHYFIHPDPSQCRSLTVREAARLQTFPDNYFFEGPRTQQYHQVGNAVPPFLAHQIAALIAKLF
jgi:DNA (cytosine-5)-methyltransferase 1